MAIEEQENQTKAQSAREETASSAEDFSGELNEPRWSVISFENCLSKDLTYAQAEQKLKELEAENVAGLCVVTNEVAARVSRASSA